MNNDQFEAILRAGEAFHSLRVPREKWVVIRVDGRGFSRFTQAHFDKPFDARFHELMVETAQTLLEEWDGIFAYTESDEISLLLTRDWSHFDREVEKIVSLTAATASVAFSLASGQKAHFDSRIWLGESIEDVMDYFRWRQSDALRCALNGWCYWTLRGEGQSVRQATAALEKQTSEQKIELLSGHDVNFAELPLWQRRGVGLHWESYEKTGYNPRNGQAETARRRRVRIERALPAGESYESLLRALIAALEK